MGIIFSSHPPPWSKFYQYQSSIDCVPPSLSSLPPLSYIHYCKSYISPYTLDAWLAIHWKYISILVLPPSPHHMQCILLKLNHECSKGIMFIPPVLHAWINIVVTLNHRLTYFLFPHCCLIKTKIQERLLLYCNPIVSRFPTLSA